jgi:hypothetical protein
MLLEKDMATPRKRLAWIGAALAALLLVACTAGVMPAAETAGDESRTEDMPADDNASGEDVSGESGSGQIDGDSAAEEPAASVGDDLLTGDDRSASLRAVTGGWGTNWERRTIETSELISGGPPRDGIPSIDDPDFVTFNEAAAWLADTEPVIALEINGDAHAYPLQILIWHEIANDTVGGVPVAVTFCPLCNSAIVFDRRFGGEILEFGTSGLLRNSDLVMYDRTTETLWQQFTGEGLVGDLAGEQLAFIPASVVSFADFRAAYPEGVVLSRDTGVARNYGANPYAGYDDSTDPFLFRGEPDDRLPAMMRVVSVEIDGVAKAYPYNVLAEQGAINDTLAGREIVVFHVFGTNSALGASIIAEAEDVGATGVYERALGDRTLTFSVEEGRIVDGQTGTVWNVAGQGVEGPLAGETLTKVVAGDHFWFSWAAFWPDTLIYEAESGERTANADVIFVRAAQSDDGSWTFQVTVEHPDTGWEDYADGWDVMLPDGTVVRPDPASPFTRLLLHPHETEQPFTRSQAGIVIPDGVRQVTVRAHDLVDGFGGREVAVDLTVDSGPGFEVVRAP